MDGVKSLLNGGNVVDTKLALVYSIISTIGCMAVYILMNTRGKSLSSDIIKSEGNQWLMDTVVSLGVLVGFVISLMISNTSFAFLSKYVDPVMVIIISILFIKVPIKTFINSFKEIINVKADDEINKKIYTIVKDIEEEYNFEDSVTRVSKIGRELRIEIDFVFNDYSNLTELKEMDKVREEVLTSMKGIKLDKWLNVNFTGDKKWAL